MTITFKPDERVGQMFEAYSLDCIDWAKATFQRDLPVTEEGVRDIESIADVLFNSMPPEGVPPEVMAKMEKMLGSHIAQVLIKVKGWVPGIAIFPEGEIPGVQLEGENMCWPWGKVHNRLINGAEDNLWFYYRSVTRQLGDPITDLNTLH